ncbi:hypothetical protein ACVWZV_009004 [Bradyrhizobium sp. GM5.1]|uniref:transposase n=1 Tax=Bradyrhizobium sp. 156 TaxID=2782630 RepID=UPI001FF9FAC3|nr:transposase [Bradyrhizobium sp. 156]
MGLDSKKDVHLDGSSVGPVSRLEVLEGPSGRRVRSEAERARIVAESLLPGAQVSEVARKHEATRWQIYDLATAVSTARHVAAVRGVASDIRATGCAFQGW